MEQRLKNRKDGARSGWLNVFFGLIIFATFYSIYLLFMPSTYYEMGFYSVVSLMLSALYLFCISKMRLVSFPGFFVILTWIFHFGQFALYAFDSQSLILYNFMELFYQPTELVDSFSIALLFYLALVLGVSAPISPKGNLATRKVEISKRVLTTATIVFIPCYVVFLFNVLSNLNASGYLSTETIGWFGYVYYVLYFCSMVIFLDALNKNNFVKVVLMYIAFAFGLFTGIRGMVVCVLLTFLLIHLRYKRIKLRYYILFAIALVIVGYLIRTIGSYRNDFATMFAMMLSSENFIDYCSSNPLLNVLGEFGGTFMTVLAAVRNFSMGGDTANGLLFGTTYVAALLCLIPGATRLVPSVYINFITNVPAIDYHALGGSIIGEAYVNLGALGFVLMFLLGIFVRYLYEIENRASHNNVLVSCLVFTLYVLMFMVIRGYIKNIVFAGVWGLLIVIFLTRTSEVGKDKNA